MAESKEVTKGICSCCGKECTLTVDGKIWHHHPQSQDGESVADCYSGPDSKRCKGAGEPPAGARPEPTGDEIRFLCRVPSGPEGCGHQVQLTPNHRARSHLTPQGEQCTEGGSVFPIAVGPDGYRADTADWTEEDWERVFPKPVLPAADARNATVSPRQVETIDLPHDRQPEDPSADETIAEIEATRPADALFDVTHDFSDEATQTYGVHPGEVGDCRLPGCCTHPGGFTYGDDDNGHSGSVCMICGAEEPEPVPPPEPEKTIEELSRYTVGELVTGEMFVRHRAKPPLNTLVFRVQLTGSDGIDATVVSAGAHAGRTGALTNLSEEITCTDLNGRPRPRLGLQAPAASAPAATRTPSSGPSTPLAPTAATRPSPTRSRPAPTTPAPSPAPSSTPPTTASAPPRAASSRASSSKTTASGPTAKAATSTPSAGKTEVADAFSTAKQATAEADRYDRFGRYKLTHPATRKPVKWTRATTFAKSIADTYNLSMWSQRMVLKGASLRPDIVAAVSTLEVKADRDRVNGLVEDAKKAAGNKVAANLGTALHAFTEDRDKVLVGMPVKAKTVPENLLPSVDAYEALLQEFGLQPVPGLIEFTTAVMQYEIAGTSDRCYKVTRDITFKLHGRTVTLYAGEYVIGDVKSGADLSYGWMEICIQLAIYAQGLNTSGVFDWNQATWGNPAYLDKNGQEVRIQVRTDVGLIPHLPVDRKPGDPLATLFAVDLDWGWATAVLCGQVRSARKEGNLATALTVADVEEAPEPPNEPLQRAAARARSVVSRPPTLEEKAQTVTTQAAASAVWKEAVAARTPKTDVDRLIQIMKTKLESHVEQGA